MKLMRLSALIIIMATLLASCRQQAPESVGGFYPPTPEKVDSVSYYLGVVMGSMIKGYGFAENSGELNLAEVKKGLEEYFSGTADQDLEMMGEVMTEYLRTRQNYLAAVATKKQERFMNKNKLEESVDTLPSGLQYSILENGSDVKVQDTDTITVNYTAMLLDGTVFDKQDTLEMVAGELVKGFTQGVKLIGEGGKVKLYVPFEIGYRKERKNGIPPFSTLVYDVEVIKVKPFIEKENEDEE